MNPFKYRACWISAALLTASTALGQNYPFPSETTPTMAGYNASSRIEVQPGWDVYSTASFTYWNPIQENMELGIVSDTSRNVYSVNGNVVNLNFDYKPGFKVGLGVNLDRDGWDAFTEYTWFRGKQTTTTVLATTLDDVLIPAWTVPIATSPTYFYGNEEWSLRMDLLDLVMARSYYVGKALTFRPLFGARAAWIRQTLDVQYLNEATGFLTRKNEYVKQRSQSWAVGPRAGLYANWLLGKGCRLYGSTAGDVLYTQYTKLRYRQYATTATGLLPANGGIFHVKQKNLHYLRAHIELELGLGWGSYFCGNKWHADLSAGYGFQVFFDQNMFRNFTDDAASAKSLSPNGNLYIHGLTASARFDF